jgi:protein-L-isoaspartate(D-aspartate) O-methyltransferase
VANLAHQPTVQVVAGDGASAEFSPADIIYVNAGATHPAPAWLDRLNDGGRLILPLTDSGMQHGDVRRGAVFRIARRGEDFTAQRISAIAIFPCAGGRDEDAERALATAFHDGGAEKVRRLYRRDDLPKADCWLRGRGWCLAYR